MSIYLAGQKYSLSINLHNGCTDNLLLNIHPEFLHEKI
ncbi:hypothetical protein [Pseudomonas fluorescens]|nr:hypothetical protein [Pseudomonas fluorescens]